MGSAYNAESPGDHPGLCGDACSAEAYWNTGLANVTRV